MKTISHLSLAVAALVIVACKNQTNRPVTTKSDQGTTTTAAGDVAENRGTTLVRVVNALPGHHAVTIRADTATPFDNVAYKTVTPYRELRGNNVKFVLYDAAQVPPVGPPHDEKDSSYRPMRDANDSSRKATEDGLATNHEVMQDGERYTVFVMPSDDGTGARMRIVRDELKTDEAKARIRFVNAVPLGGELDLKAKNQKDPIFDDVNYGNEGSYKDVDPMTVSLVVRGDKTPPATVRDIKRLEAGKSYTVVAAGKKGKVDVIEFEDVIGGGTNASPNDGKQPK